MTTVKFTEDAIKEYLDTCIRYWRQEWKKGNSIAEYYIDAFQSVRISLFGELLKEENVNPATGD